MEEDPPQPDLGFSLQQLMLHLQGQDSQALVNFPQLYNPFPVFSATSLPPRKTTQGLVLKLYLCIFKASKKKSCVVKSQLIRCLLTIFSFYYSLGNFWSNPRKMLNPPKIPLRLFFPPPHSHFP